MSENSNISPQGSDKPQQLTDAQLLAYLEGNLPPDEQRQVELWLADEGMESDAIEGLKELDIDDTKRSVHRLNRKLKGGMLRKKRRGNPGTDLNVIAAILLILLFAVMAYVVIRVIS